MKQFFKMFFASLLAVFFAAVCMALFFIILISGIAALSKPQPVVRQGSILVFDMSVNVQDRPVSTTSQEIIDEAMGRLSSRNVSLLSLTRGLRAAAEDDAIEGLLLTGSFQTEAYGSGFAALKEVKEAVEAFAATGKPVWAYTVYPTARDMYVLSAVEKIFMNPEGLIADSGMAMTYPYLGGFMDKYGIGVQVTRAGEYKAAAESLVLEGMSEPAREANQEVLNDFWKVYLEALSSSSGIEPSLYEEKLNELGMLMASEALELGLVHEVAFNSAVVEGLQELVGKDEEGVSFLQTHMLDYIEAEVKPKYSSDGFIAVIYAEGSIVAGEGNEDQVGEVRLEREIRKARMDEKVKAIVLRVNSPGGSAMASEVIQKELRLAQERVPVIVSMGTLAASGGYWISAYADKIYAQPNTLTGSIGVIGVFFNFQELASEHGVNFDTVKTTEHADFMNSFRAKTEKEMDLVQRQVDLIYNSFLRKVSEGRNLTIEEVERIAEGRIWSGEDALAVGLVDELGGLRDAIAYASAQVGLGDDPAVIELPEPKDFFNELFKGFSRKPVGSEAAVLSPVLDAYEDLSRAALRFNDPKGVYAVLPYTVTID